MSNDSLYNDIVLVWDASGPCGGARVRVILAWPSVKDGVLFGCWLSKNLDPNDVSTTDGVFLQQCKKSCRSTACAAGSKTSLVRLPKKTQENQSETVASKSGFDPQQSHQRTHAKLAKAPDKSSEHKLNKHSTKTPKFLDEGISHVSLESRDVSVRSIAPV